MKPAMILLLFVLCATVTARSDEPSKSGNPGFVPRYLCECPCYCPKPFPCVPCKNLCTTCDHYCRKPMPVICRVNLSCCCDNYCRKPFPCCWPLPLCP